MGLSVWVGYGVGVELGPLGGLLVGHQVVVVQESKRFLMGWHNTHIWRKQYAVRGLDTLWIQKYI